jgi:hypothetical protein
MNFHKFFEGNDSLIVQCTMSILSASNLVIQLRVAIHFMSWLNEVNTTIKYMKVYEASSRFFCGTWS